MARLTAVDKGKIIALHELGMSNSEISRRLGFHKSTVALWVNRWQETGGVDAVRPTGRPRLTTPVQDQQIATTSRENHFFTSKHIKDHLGIAISRKTLIRRLREVGIFARWAAKKEIIKEYQRAQRLAFAIAHVNQPPEFWRKTVFTDEKVFSSTLDGRIVVFRPPRKRHDPEYVKHRAYSGRFSVTVWGWICYEGVGMLYEIEGYLTGIQYCGIMRNVMLPSVLEIYPDMDFNFLHDRSPIHTSRVARACIQEMGIRVLDWPPKGCDMNVIENFWAEMMRMPNEEQNPPLNKAALSQRIHDIWEHLTESPNYLHSLVDSMQRRLQEVIDNDGMFSSY